MLPGGEAPKLRGKEETCYLDFALGLQFELTSLNFGASRTPVVEVMNIQGVHSVCYMDELDELGGSPFPRALPPLDALHSASRLSVQPPSVCRRPRCLSFTQA